MVDPATLDAGEPKETKADQVIPKPLDWGKVEKRGPELWEKFCTWAEWYLRRFEIQESVVPPCWGLHPVLVEELTGLWTAFMYSYSEMVTGTAPLVFLHQANESRARMAASMGIYDCTREHHEGPSVARRKSHKVSFAEALTSGLPSSIALAPVATRRTPTAYHEGKERELCHTDTLGEGSVDA